MGVGRAVTKFTKGEGCNQVSKGRAVTMVTKGEGCNQVHEMGGL